MDDQFYFAHQRLDGNGGSITARLTSMTDIITYPPPNHDQIVSGVVPWAKVGVIIKESTQQGSAYAAMMITGGHGARMRANFTEDVAGRPEGISATSPRWLRLTLSGDTLTGYELIDGIQWTRTGSAHLARLTSKAQVGLFARDEIGGIDVGPAPLDRGNQSVRHFAVVDREVDPEVIGFDFAARFGGRPLDLFATTAGFLGGEEATEPPVAELADAAKRRRVPAPKRFAKSRSHGTYVGTVEGLVWSS